MSTGITPDSAKEILRKWMLQSIVDGAPAKESEVNEAIENEGLSFMFSAMREYAEKKCQAQREIIQVMNPHHTDFEKAPPPLFD